MGVKEPFNTVSHGLGVVLSIVGLVYLVVVADGAMAIVSYTIYGAALVTLYTASTLYHALPLGPRGVRVFRKIDHSAIFILIAGTYTPVCLISAPPAWGWSIFGVVWGLAIAGIVGKSVWHHMPDWLGVALYIALGWTAVVAVVPLVQTFPWEALLLLLAGGIAYTVGALVYARHWLNVLPRHVGSHGVFHLFVLAGSLLHFVFIVGWVR